MSATFVRMARWFGVPESDSQLAEARQPCDYPECDDPTTVRDGRGNRYCADDHLIAARNEIDPSALDEYEVEYNGVSGTCREKSREAAERQWKHHILARRSH